MKQRGELPPIAPRRPLPPVELDDVERAYLAGLFDGEGSVNISKLTDATKRRPAARYFLRVGIVMTHAETVYAFRAHFGGRSVRLDRRRDKVKYIWGTEQQLALRCLLALAPALRVKRPHAEIAVAFMDTFRIENQGRNPLGRDVLDERLRLVEALSALNDSHWRRKRLLRESQLNQ